MSKTLPGGRKLLENVTLGLIAGAKVGVLGTNGSGKSSLLKIIAGIDKDVDGTVWHRPGLRTFYLAQEPELREDFTVMQSVRDGISEQTAMLERFESVSAAMGDPSISDDGLNDLLMEQADLQGRIDDLGAWSLQHRVDAAMMALNTPPPNTPIAGLSGGEQRRVALCSTLLRPCDVLLLDEPTNHLDASSVAWLEGFLRDFKGSVVCVTHDRYFLENVAEWILEIDRGIAHAHHGNYTSWLDSKVSSPGFYG